MMKNVKVFPRLWEEYSWSRAVSLKPLTQLCLGSPKIVEPKSALVKLVNYLGGRKTELFRCVVFPSP